MTHRHLSNASIAARILQEQGVIRAYDAVYDLRCTCGIPKRNTRLAATIHGLRHDHGWDITTENSHGRLATYVLVSEGTFPEEPTQPEPDRERDPLMVCTGCGIYVPLSQLQSKYGKPQVVGYIKDKRLMEAKCPSCDKKPHKGMQAVWKEQ